MMPIFMFLLLIDSFTRSDITCIFAVTNMHILNSECTKVSNSKIGCRRFWQAKKNNCKLCTEPM